MMSTGSKPRQFLESVLVPPPELQKRERENHQDDAVERCAVSRFILEEDKSQQQIIEIDRAIWGEINTCYTSHNNPSAGHQLEMPLLTALSMNDDEKARSEELRPRPMNCVEDEGGNKAKASLRGSSNSHFRTLEFLGSSQPCGRDSVWHKELLDTVRFVGESMQV